MLLDVAKIRKRLSAFEFKQLFVEELGWDRYTTDLTVPVDGHTLTLSSVAEKRGMPVFVCEPDSNGGIPDGSTRRKIERRVTKSVHEHLIVFVDGRHTTQIWHWVRRERGKRLAAREHCYHTGQSGESLIQKLGNLAVSLKEEEHVTLPDVMIKAKVFDVERATKAFYDRFKEERKRFLGFLTGIPDKEMQAWYVCIMLNRLMFIYFLQKKRFLDDDPHYLRNKFAKFREGHQRDRFYRDFLCPLFFEGFARWEDERSPRARDVLGRVPYLNGGIFQKHRIERLHGHTINIPDKPFESLFEFFDAFHWHLDDRHTANDNEICPDILGYVFEKYINQKEMGAYYTKEDITEYICRNTIIPFLLGATKEMREDAFEGEMSVWRLLQDAPDRYIDSSIKHGTSNTLPPVIANGLDPDKPNVIERRRNWNERAPSEYALDGETWRDVVARRHRYAEMRDRLIAGEIQSIDDLVACNLDIYRFAIDVIKTCKSPDLLSALWEAIEQISVLDPTCGSGAFLFAALKVLAGLQEASLDRMARYLDEWRLGRKKNSSDYSDVFSQILNRMGDPSKRDLSIVKSILTRNLYGVDILDEGVEICRLRLFLALASLLELDQSKPNLGIKPLPDLDFNIRTGNTLVGFASLDQVRNSFAGKLPFPEVRKHVALIEKQADAADHTLSKFQKMQMDQQVSNHEAIIEAKDSLKTCLNDLSNELDEFLAGDYGVNIADRSCFEKWRGSHKPFHWLSEFHGIMRKGGFDVVIGNPPFVGYSDASSSYRVQGYSTLDSRNLYAYVVERSMALLQRNGGIGMTVPVSLTFSRDFPSLRRLLLERKGLLMLSSYDNIPDRLFTGAKESENTSKANQQRITIFLSIPAQRGALTMTTPLLRWRSSERERLFAKLPYVDATALCGTESFPKLGSRKLRDFLILWKALPKRLVQYMDKHGKHHLVVPRTAGYYIAAYPDEMARTKQMVLRFPCREHRDLAFVLLNSNVFFWLWRVIGDGFDVTTNQIEQCPTFGALDEECTKIAADLEAALPECTVYKGYRGVQVPNVNFNKRMDLLWRADEWIIKHVAPSLSVTPEDFLWAKSSSFLKLSVAKSANLPPGFDFVAGEN